jgi:hypothetical protein
MADHTTVEKAELYAKATVLVGGLLGVLAILAFAPSDGRMEYCIDKGMQWIDGDCVK